MHFFIFSHSLEKFNQKLYFLQPLPYLSRTAAPLFFYASERSISFVANTTTEKGQQCKNNGTKRKNAIEMVFLLFK